MTTPRTAPYLPVTGISRYLTGDKSCLFAAWFKANHQGLQENAQRLQFGQVEHGAHRPDERACRRTRRARVSDIHREAELFSRRERPAPVLWSAARRTSSLSTLTAGR